MKNFRCLTKLTSLIAIMVAVALASGGELRAGAMIVSDGVGNAEIVIAAEPARMTRLAARELQHFIAAISGAELPIVTEPGEAAVKIYVGASPYTEKLGVVTDDLGHGAYRAVSGPDWLVLAGRDYDFERVEPYIRARNQREYARVHEEWDAISGGMYHTPFMSVFSHFNESLGVSYYDDAGTLNAVYDFIRDLGARWYFPGEIGEILPELSSIALPDVDETVRADFDLRNFRYYFERLGLSDDEALWNLRMGVNPGHDIIGQVQPGHGMKFVHMRDDFKEAHPEYFALRGGERALNKPSPGAPNLSSEGLLREHVQFVRAVFDHYDEPMISIDITDGYGALSEEEPCRSMGTPERGFQGRMSDYVWGYLNRVAAEVYETHPDKLVSGLAYSGYQLPPLKIETMSPNLAIIECRWRSNFYSADVRDRFRQLREEWLEMLPSGQWFVWDYYLHPSRSRGETPHPNRGRPVYFTRAIADDLGSLKGVSRGDTIEVYRHPNHIEHGYDWSEYAINHLNLYVTSRYWWDSQQDLDEVMEEFYTLYYGPARQQMKAFITFSEENWPVMGSDIEVIDETFALLKAAIEAAPEGSVYADRIQITADYVEMLRPWRERLAQGREGPTVTIPVLAEAGLAIDGRLDDSFWQNAPEFRLGNVVDGGPADVPATVRLAWLANDSLVIGIRCEEPDMAGLRDPATARNDMAIWNGDMVEIFLETPVHSYYQIAVSPSGTLLDLNRPGRINTGWSAEATVATHRGKDYWSVEIVIPAAGASAEELYPDEGISGDRPTATSPWYFNIGRQRVREGESTLTTLAPTGRKHFHEPFRFGTLVVE